MPFSNGETLYRLYAGPKDCLFTENARHIETMYREPALYAEKLDRMIRDYVSD